MARTFELDTQAARDANSGGKRITESGKFTGTLTAAWSETYPSGAEAVCFKFESDQGQEAGPLMLFTHGRDGQALGGFNMLQALMTCGKVRSIQPQPGQVSLYDFNEGKEVTKQKDTYPALTNKRIGLLLRQEETTDQNGVLKTRDDGTPKTRMIIFAPFDPETEMVASEILDKAAQPIQLPRMVRWLAENPVKQAKNAQRQNAGGGQYGGYAAQPYQPTPGQQGMQGPTSNDFDDEIPFAPMPIVW